MLAGAGLDRGRLQHLLDALASDCQGCIGVNFLVPFLDPSVVEVAARGARVVEFFYDEPDPELIAAARAHGALACWQVGSVDEAVRAQEAGCDLVVAQGVEAGGHVRGRLPLASLLPEVVSRLDLPIIAAGGIGTAQDVARAFALGAAAVRVGTRFVATVESDAHDRYVDALVDASADATELTQCFSAGWPHAPHRVLRGCIGAAQALTDDAVGEVERDGRSFPLPRLGVSPPTRATTGHISAMPLYAGCGVGSVTGRQSVAEVIAELGFAVTSRGSDLLGPNSGREKGRNIGSNDGTA